jgi:hypothetical protein
LSFSDLAHPHKHTHTHTTRLKKQPQATKTNAISQLLFSTIIPFSV